MTNHIEKLNKLNNEKLVDVVKNYKQYGYDEMMKEDAISILQQRGISVEDLQLTGNFTNQKYNQAEDLSRTFKNNSRTAFVLFLLLIFENVFYRFVSINSESLAWMFWIASIAIFIGYFIFLLLSFLNQSQFYRMIGEEYGAEGALIYFLVGMPLYIVMYFYFRNQMNEKLKEIR